MKKCEIALIAFVLLCSLSFYSYFPPIGLTILILLGIFLLFLTVFYSFRLANQFSILFFIVGLKSVEKQVHTSLFNQFLISPHKMF